MAAWKPGRLTHCIWGLLTILSRVQLGDCQAWGQFPQLNMCARESSYGNNIIIADGVNNARQFTETECVCRIYKKVPALIRFINVDFSCIPPRTWEMEFYIDGCLEHTITCDIEGDGEFFIPYQSTATDIYIRLKNLNPSIDESGSYYYVEVKSTAEDTATRPSRIIKTECGLSVESINATTEAGRIIETHCGQYINDIPTYLCGAPPQSTSTTTTQSATPEASSTQSSTSTVTTSTSRVTTSTSSVTTSTTESIFVPQAQSSKKDDTIIDNPVYLGVIIGGGAVVLIIIIIVFVVLCRRRRHEGGDKDSESVYSYSRSLPGSVSKDMQTAQRTVDKHREKEQRKREKAEERDRKREEKRRMEEARHHVYDKHIDPNTFDNPAYMSGTQTSMPDFIPPPPAPPQGNGFVQNNDIYAQVNKESKTNYKKNNKKEKKDKSNKKNKDKKREIAVMNGGSVPYGYYDKVVDSEFSFMEDDMYGGDGKY